MPAKKKTVPINFEKSLDDLEAVVEKLESGDVSLEQSLKQFEQGITLAQACQKALQEAEQKVQILIEKNDQTRLEDFDHDDDE